MNPKDAAAVKKGKVRLDLNPPAGSEAQARALASGAAKYGAWNWRKDPVQYSFYVAAMRRHLDALMRGEDIARDSGVHHLGHVMAGAAILLDSIEQGVLIDDRPGNAKKRMGSPGVSPHRVRRRGKGGRRVKRNVVSPLASVRSQAAFGKQE